MDILLVGYGKMGKTIERVALERGHTIAGKIDIDNARDLDSAQGDVAIEFSHPDAAYHNVKKCIQRKIPVVCGTTGWLERKGEIEALAKETGSTFFYSSNFSPGVNVLFRLNEHLARMMNQFSAYEVRIDEVHHVQKKDAPSGTAISLAEVLATSDLPGGVVNILTGSPAELAPWLASHPDIHGLDLVGAGDLDWIELQIAAAATLTRVLPPERGPDAASPSLERIAAFTETKTIWHTKSLV